MSSSKNSVDISYHNNNYNPEAPPLTNEQTKLAVKELVRNYERVARYKVDQPIMNQDVTMLSYMLLKEPVNGVYGFVKARGAWASAEVATDKSEAIIKTGDSLFPIHLAPTGHWVPITNNEQFSKDQLDVKSSEQDRTLRDRAAKDNAEKNKELQREIQERKEQLESETDDIDADHTTLDYYTKKQVSLKEINSHIRKIKEQEKTTKKAMKKVRDELDELNKLYPQYSDQWLANYNKARKRVGLDEYVSEADFDKVPVLGNLQND